MMRAVVTMAMVVMVAVSCSKKVINVEEPVFATRAPSPAPAVVEPVLEVAPVEPPRYTVLPICVVYFDFDSDKLRPDAYLTLDQTVKDWGGRCTVKGYACTIGSEDYNQDLSTRRARAVADYIGGGTVEGFGESLCTASCATVQEVTCTQCRKVEVWP